MKAGFIGIDLGTSAVKLLLMDEAGTVCKTVSKEYKFKALQNTDYANGQYALDMSREKLYTETDKRLR